MVQVIKVSLMVTVGFVPGSIAATCDLPVTELVVVSKPDLLVVIVTVTDWSGRRPVTVINPVELMLACPALDVTA